MKKPASRKKVRGVNASNAKKSVTKSANAKTLTAKARKESSKNDFYSKVYALVRRVPFGKVTTYGTIAQALGTGLSARMVGYAMHVCPKDVPAHRVVNRFGALTGRLHFGHPDLMRELLEDEGVTFLDDETVDMKKHFVEVTARKKK
jgi:methylated-DNA-protein-cysteine methyltransferase related protein